jgi:ABC-2 type transport system permease protein
MRRLALHGAAAGAVFRRDVAMFASYRMRLFTTVFSTIVTLTIFYYVSRLVNAKQVGSPDDYYAFAVIGIVIFSVVTSTLTLPIGTLRAELLAGTFERMVVSPFGPVRCIVSLMLFPVALAFTTSSITLVYAGLAFGLDLRWPEALAGIPVAMLAAFAFAPFGLFMAAAVVVFKQTNAGATFIITAITLLAGVYFPVSLLPGWIRWASEVQPFTPSVDLLRNLVVGTPLGDPVWQALLKIVLFPVVMMPAALAALHVAVRHSRRRGTITEY